MLHSDGQGQALFDGVHLVDIPVSAQLGLYSMLLRGLKKKRKSAKTFESTRFRGSGVYVLDMDFDGWSMSSIG